METINENRQPENESNKNSITIKMITVAILVLALCIPLHYIKKLIEERMHRQVEVVQEINKKWGSEVILYGPILKIPYKVKSSKRVYDKITKTYSSVYLKQNKFAYFFPEKLDIKADLNPEEKKRGIYTTAVYKSNMSITGNFTKPNFKEGDIDEKDIQWDKARIIIQTSNLKGVNELVKIKLNNTSYGFKAKHSNSNMNNLESKYINRTDLPSQNNVEFSLNLNMNGSKQIRFIPIGRETTTNITSKWESTNSIGEYLPYNADKITADGFNGKWKVLDINRGFSQEHFESLPDLGYYAFGVNFMIPIDEYTKSERSTKYGFLVIGLTFLVFFLIQLISKIEIHPFQYLMIGVALTMFYTLLISISEHSSFLKAYIIATIAVVALISVYSKSILKGIKFPIFIGVSLLAIYSFIFIIIQLENYSLIVGSIGLFVILSIVMFASRKIDWNNS